MGVDYRAVVGIGKTFYDRYAATEFLEQYNVLDDEDRGRIEEDGLVEWLCDNSKVEGCLLDYYRCDYFFVGYELVCTSPESFRKSFEEGMDKWSKHFPDVDADVIKTVQIY